MMRSLLFVSLVCCGMLSSCASARSGCRKAGERTVARSELRGIVDTSAGVNKYNLQINIARTHLSGMLHIKQMRDESFRIVFTTHFGMRVFDFEFSGDSVTVHYCIEAMQKEKMIRLFKNDLGYLLGGLGEENRIVGVYQDRLTGGREIEVFRPERNLFYRKNLKQGGIEKITLGRGWRKTTWDFEDFRSGYPWLVYIHHAFWPITLKLERL